MSSKQVENVEFEFDPQGLRVLAVDDSVVCLKILVALLEKCHYKVSATTDANEALKLLRENKDRFDIVLTDVVRSDMDGFTLMEIIRDEIDIPVILLSASDDRTNVMKGVNKGARDYLLKPPRMEEIKNIWQHVVRKKLLDHRTRATYNVSSNRVAKTTADENKDRNPQHPVITSKKESARSSKDKKRRVQWTPKMHAKFVEVVRPLGVFSAVPKKILELMTEYPTLTRENVASHLQKYRRTLLTQKSDANADPNAAAGNPLLLAAVAPLDTTTPDQAPYQQRPDEMQSYNQITHPAGSLQNPQHTLQVQPHFDHQGHPFAAAAHRPPSCQFPDRNWVVDHQSRVSLFDPQHYYQPPPPQQQQQQQQHQQQRDDLNHRQVYSHIPGYGSYVPPVSCFRPSEVLPTSTPSFSGPGIDLPAYCLPDHYNHYHQMPGQPPNFSENQWFGQLVPEDMATETSISSGFSSADDDIATLMVEFNRNGDVPQL